MKETKRNNAASRGWKCLVKRLYTPFTTGQFESSSKTDDVDQTSNKKAPNKMHNIHRCRYERRTLTDDKSSQKEPDCLGE